MAEFMTIDVRGDKELDRMFKRAGDAFTPRVLLNGMMAGGLIAQNTIKALAPYKTGVYRKTIHLEAVPELLAVKIGSNMPGAAMQEYGGVVVPVKAKFLHFFVDGEEVFTKGPVCIPAHPHFRPGLSQSKEQVLQAVRDAILQQLRKAVR